MVWVVVVEGVVETKPAVMNGSRVTMAAAWSRYHMECRRLKLLETRWKTEGASLVGQLQAYYDAQARARSLNPWFDQMAPVEQEATVGADVYRKGVQADERCQAANAELTAARLRCSELLKQALHDTGSHHGARMALDVGGSVRVRYWRHAREMATTIRSNLPRNRLVGVQDDFEAALGWARSMGLKSARALVALLAREGVAAPCVLAC